MISNNTEDGTGQPHVDLFRDTWVRYLGYANEVGEAFRSQIGGKAVALTYVISFGYAAADAADKTLNYQQPEGPSGSDKQAKHTEVGRILDLPYREPSSTEPLLGSLSQWQRRAICGGDALLWQTLASVLIPGFTINRVVALSRVALKSTSSLSPGVRRWAATAIGLVTIPFIVHPIDEGVTQAMDATVRRLYKDEVRLPK
eukprot:Clim_evm53s201 gene=Clim_evmTU53s201